MIKRFEIKNNYISVGGHSYGGSQMLFQSLPGVINTYRSKAGCGIVAVSDVLSYLKGTSTFKDEDEYRAFFRKISKYALWIPSSIGSNFLQLSFAMHMLFIRYSVPCHCFWSFSKKKLYSRIKHMIQNDVPVILCIPKTLFKRQGIDFLPFYDQNLNVINGASGHFVVITGIYEDPNTHKLYLKISSWGKSFFISFEEYVTFSRRHIAGYLGNIMYIVRNK